MQFVDASLQGESFTQLNVEHNGGVINWSLGFYSRPRDIEVPRVFEHVNGFLASLSQERQANIFFAYERLKSSIDDVVDPAQVHVHLTKATKKLYELFTFEELTEWVRRNGNIRIPPSITERYDELDISKRNESFEDRTYLRSEYFDLVVLAIYMRFMIPVWSEYAIRLQQYRSNTSFREYQVMSVLKTSSAVSVPPMNRLRQYIEMSNEAEIKTQMSAALGSLGSSELPDWLLSLAVVRKLVLVEVSTGDDANNIIRVMYRHVKNTLKSMDRKFSGRVTNKTNYERGDDDPKSVLDGYKIKQQISVGDLMTMSVYTRNPVEMAIKYDPSIDKRMVIDCYDHTKKLINHQPTHGQIVLLSWVLSRIMPPTSVYNINRQSLMACQAMTQAVLWHWGFYDLAILLTASEVRDMNGHTLGGVESRTRILKEYVEKLMVLYPHYQENGVRERDRQVNMVCKTIDSITPDFVKCDWSTTAPKALQKLGTSVDDRGIVVAPNDIKTQLCELVLKLNNLNQQTGIEDHAKLSS